MAQNSPSVLHLYSIPPSSFPILKGFCCSLCRVSSEEGQLLMRENEASSITALFNPIISHGGRNYPALAITAQFNPIKSHSGRDCPALSITARFNPITRSRLSVSRDNPTHHGFGTLALPSVASAIDSAQRALNVLLSKQNVISHTINWTSKVSKGNMGQAQQ